MKKKLLVFSRPIGKVSQLTNLYSELENLDVHYISDFKYYGEFNFVKDLYKILNSTKTSEKDAELDYDDIIKRDRYLNYIERGIAEKLVTSAWIKLDHVFKEQRFDAFIGLPLDNYILHLLYLVCKKYKVKSIFPGESPLPGYLAIRDFWNHCYIREPEEKEIDAIYNLLSSKTFRPTWLKTIKNSNQLIKLYLKERIKKIAFEILKVVLRDKYSFHFNCIYPMNGAITIRTFEATKVRTMFDANLEEIKEKIKSFNRVVYFALQFTPENSLNYGIDQATFSDYQRLVGNLLSSIKDDTVVLVKEHPDFYGYRDPSFYNFIKSFKNVILVDIAFNTDTMLTLADYIIITASASTGIEAIIKDKTVISLGGAFYDNEGFMHHIWNFEDVKKINDYLNPIKLGSQEKRRFIKRILQSTLPGAYDFEYRREKNDDNHRKTIREITNYLINENYSPSKQMLLV